MPRSSREQGRAPSHAPVHATRSRAHSSISDAQVFAFDWRASVTNTVGVYSTARRSRNLDERLASAADPNLHGLPEWIRGGSIPAPSGTYVDNSDRCMELVILNGLGAWRKLTYRYVNRAIYSTGFVLVVCKWIVVIEVSHPRRESKHRQNTL